MLLLYFNKSNLHFDHLDCTQSADFSFVLDASGSVGVARFERVKELASDLIRTLNIDDGFSQAGLMTFSSRATIHATLDRYNTREDLIEAVSELEYEGGTTETGAVLRMIREQMYTSRNGDRPGFNNIVILFTDGGSSNFDDTLEQAILTKLAGISIIVVAISDWYNEFEIREIASDPDRFNVFELATAQDFDTFVPPIRRAMCNGWC